MILSSGSGALLGTLPSTLALGAMLAYGVAALPSPRRAGLSTLVLLLGFSLHLGLLLIDVGGWGQAEPGIRLGFAPVLSMTVWLVLALHTIESRLVPLPTVRRVLALVGALAVLLAWLFPGEMRRVTSPQAPLHYVLGVASYGLFGAAVLHAALLDAAERRMRRHRVQDVGGLGMPLLQLERLTFRFVAAGFVALTATLALGMLNSLEWRWDHKTVLSLLAWTVFAALLAGRRLYGWRGRRATRWLYGGAGLLLLAYAGSRFVFEVLLHRGG